MQPCEELLCLHFAAEETETWSSNAQSLIEDNAYTSSDSKAQALNHLPH